MLNSSQIKQCNKCGAEISFAKSHAGKWYPADVDRSSGKPELTYAIDGGILPGKRRSATYPKLHRCIPSRDEIERTIDDLRERLMEEEAALENGEWGIDTISTHEAINAWEHKLAILYPVLPETDRSTAPFANRPEIQVEPDGEVLWA